MSYANPEVEPSANLNVESSANPEVEAARQVRDFLAGRSDAKVGDLRDRVVRQIVGAELLAAMYRGGPDETAHCDTEEQERAQGERERARQLFMDCGYLDETVHDLRSADSPTERADAARTLGLVGSGLGTAHLIAALFDVAPEVRRAAGDALGQIGDPAVANAPLEDLLNNEMDAETLEAAEPTYPVQSVAVDEPADAEPAGEEMRATDHQTTLDDPAGQTEEAQLLLQENAVRKMLRDLERRLIEAAAARKEAEKEARLRTEWEASFRAEAAARRREEEALRKRAEEEATRRRSEAEETLIAEQGARAQAEEEANRLAEEETRLRLEAGRLRQASEELTLKRADIEAANREAAEVVRRAESERARQEAEEQQNAEIERLRREEEALHRAVEESALRRAEVEVSRREAEAQAQRLLEEKEQLATAEAARRAEAERLRHEAEERSRAEQEQLLQQVGALRRLAEEVALRRAEIEAAREKADEEAQRLLEAQARMKAAEQDRLQAEAERLRLEAEIFRQAEEEHRLLQDVRRRAQEEQQRLEEEAQRRAAEEERRAAELDALRKKTETEIQQRVEKEQQIRSQVERLRIVEAEARKRIEEAEVRRRTAEEAHRLATERAQRVEAEAHVRAIEEERMLAKLEEVRRNVAVEAQARAEQEKRIREEIELLRGLEEEKRRRVEEGIRQRAEAETRLQQERDRLKNEEEARLRAEVQLNLLAERYRAAKLEAPDWRDDPAENLWPAGPTANGEASTAFPAVTAPEQGPIFAEGGAASDGPHAIVVDLNSVDPDKRAAALAGLAQLSAKDAFSLIANCFDDDSLHVRKAAARALRDLDPQRAVESFTRALEEASPERRRNIGGAIAASGLAKEAINALNGESREDTYNALCLLFLMAKTGEVQPLVQTIEEHQSVEVCGVAIKLLTLSDQSEIADAALKRRRNVHEGNGKRPDAETGSGSGVQ